MDTHQHLVGRLDLALHQGDMSPVIQLILKHVRGELAEDRRQLGLGDFMNECLTLHAVFNQVLDGHELEVMAFRNLLKLR